MDNIEKKHLNARKVSTSGTTQNQVGKIYERPWGTYRTIEIGENFQVKVITVKPGQQLSLQRHHHRAEHWVVVEGNPTVTVDDQVQPLSVNDTVEIPLGAMHRMANSTDQMASFVEVQVGDYLGEDDIERLEDDYGRT